NMAGLRVAREYPRSAVNRDTDRVDWPSSNERYNAQTIQYLKSLKGFEEAILICGGGTQVINILSSLQRRNHIERAHVVDTRVEQLENFLRWCGYLRTHTRVNAPVSAITPHAGSDDADKNLRSEYHHLDGLPKFSRDLFVQLHNSEVLAFLNSDVIVGKKQRFIYLSNALDESWSSGQYLYRFRKLITTDERFAEGTMLMLASSTWMPETFNFSLTAFLRKTGHELKVQIVPDFDGKPMETVQLLQPSTILVLAGATSAV
ncbi:MAG: hypothetical protein ACHQX1_02090, partial [Candidatus Micrarchaeales archaeon]